MNRKNSLLFEKARRIFPVLLSVVLLVSCQRNMLSIYSDYFTVEDLASFYVDTPDPKLNCLPFGQRLTVSWSIPSWRHLPCETQLILTIRYRNREQIIKRLTLRKPAGRYVVCLSKEQYCETGGILTYKAQLVSGNCVLEEWKHQLWAELIIFERSEEDVEINTEDVGQDFQIEEDPLKFHNE